MAVTAADADAAIAAAVLLGENAREEVPEVLVLVTVLVEAHAEADAKGEDVDVDVEAEAAAITTR
jgi:hypothetical protein